MYPISKKKTGICSVSQRAKRPITIMLLCCGMMAQAQTKGYFVTFVDKKDNGYSIDAPSAFLSERAIQRRERLGIAIDDTDLPVTRAYLDSLKKLDLNIAHVSKWMNGAIVKSSDALLMETLAKISFVKMVELTKGSSVSLAPKELPVLNGALAKNAQYGNYGYTQQQLSTINGIALHDQGFTGQGMHIAVLDAGFYHAPQMPLLARLFNNGQILGTKDFVAPGGDIFQTDTHGMAVLSIMAGYADNQFVGSAPDASYWLMRTEDAATEYPIEADYWVCAAEMADSAGVDVINSSLGYSTFDNAQLSLSYQNLDGTSRISRAADMAVSKGMVVVCSAGNEGDKTWKYILTPADASNVIAVGAMKADSTRVSFSSVGPTADNRTKPDVMAMGYQTSGQSSDGTIKQGNGTSFSAPVVSGLVACLWQSSPSLSASQVIETVRQNSHQSLSPNNLTGYGIPNFRKTVRTTTADTSVYWGISPNPFSNYLRIDAQNLLPASPIHITIFDAKGTVVARQTSTDSYVTIPNLASLTKGIYILRIEQGNSAGNYKIIKN